MAIDFDDDKEETPAPEPQPSSAENLLSGYEKPKEVETSEPIPPPLEGDKPNINTISGGETGGVQNQAWEGNPEYYQSGKKQGQKKPGRKLTASIDKNAVTTIPGSYIVTAAMFLMLIDTIIPMVLVGLNNWVSSVKVDLDDVRLKREIRKEIEPLGDATLKQLNLTGNPALMLLLAMSCHYSWNFMLARMKAKNKPNEEKK